MKFFLLITSVILSFFSASYAQQQPVLDNVDSMVKRQMEDNHIPGLALAIIKKGSIIKRAFYGQSNIESNINVDSTTIFEIASMSKQISCAAILLLQQDGLLSLSDKLSKYLKGLPHIWEEITIEQLMNHTSGLRDDWDEPTSYFITNNSDEKMSRAQQINPLLFDPGKGFKYSSGPFFLAILIKEITGKHYSIFLKNRIFDKIKMFNTMVYDSVSQPKTIAKGYWWTNGRYEPSVVIPAAAKSRADVGIITTLDDMIKWNLALSDSRLLNTQSLEAMFTAGKLVTGNAIPYGYGWYIYYFRNELIYEHGGAFRTGFNSRITKFPNTGIDIIILSNKWKANLQDLTYELGEYYDLKFKKVSGIYPAVIGSNKKDAAINKLLFNLSIKKYNTGHLYQRINISGYDADELKEILKGFKKALFIGANDFNSKPLELYNTKVTQVFFYKVIAENTTYWSFAYDKKGKLIGVNKED